MYTIRYFSISDIADIEKDWRLLEIGPSMTYFQMYDWYQSILPSIPKDCKRYESRIVALYNDGIIKVIAPVFIIKQTFKFINRKGVYLLGHGGWSDYLNFIYNNEITKDDILFILEDIKNQYGCHDFFFDELPENTLLYSTILDTLCVRSNEITTCVELKLPENEDIYLKSLSKNSRQNLRTSINRINKAGLTLSFVFDDRNADKVLCEELRKQSLLRKRGDHNLLQWLKIRIISPLRFCFHFGIPIYADINSHLMTVYINNELAAFFNYGYDRTHKRIVLMAAGTSDKYAWYSPGILLLYEFIKHEIIVHEIEVVDYTRGNEKYKYSLGGKEHFNPRIIFSF